MLKVLYRSYKPNTALTNRVLAILKGFDELGVEIEIYFFCPDEHKSKINESFRNIKITYLWRDNCSTIKLVKSIKACWYLHKFSKTLKPGDKVLLFGAGAYLVPLVNRKGVEIYQERSEHPKVVKVYPPYMQKSYLKALPNLKGMFVISNALKDYYESIGVKKATIINMIVDGHRFEGLQKTSTDRYIAYCGTALNNKDGVDQLIRAFALVNEKHPDVRLKIIGKAPGTNDVSGNVKLSNDLGIKDYVDFTGVVPSAEIPKILVNATIVALDRPDSLQAQCGFPTKLGEYLLSGTPTVVTNVGDIPLFLKDGESALIANHDNVQDFASKMIWVLEHPNESKVIGENGKQVALASFNYKIEAKKIVDVIFGKE